jgi:hypothetical protein
MSKNTVLRVLIPMGSYGQQTMTTTITIAEATEQGQNYEVPNAWWPNLERDRTRNIVFPQVKRSISESECNEMLYGMQEWVHAFICANCGGEHFYVIKGSNVRQCAACHSQSGITAGTLFETVPVSLSIWFQAIDAIINARQLFVFNLARTLRVRYTTAWLVKNELERALKNVRDRSLIMEIAHALR